jgi:cyclin-dependent kinase 7
LPFSHSIVAIKKIRLRSAAEGLSLEAIREIKLLQELDHPNVLKLMDIFSHHSNINLVLEYMTGDLEGLIRSRLREQKPLSPADIKAYMKMILEGIEHCHQRWIMHRDMKVRGQDTCATRCDAKRRDDQI